MYPCTKPFYVLEAEVGSECNENCCKSLVRVDESEENNVFACRLGYRSLTCCWQHVSHFRPIYSLSFVQAFSLGAGCSDLRTTLPRDGSRGSQAALQQESPAFRTPRALLHGAVLSRGLFCSSPPRLARSFSDGSRTLRGGRFSLVVGGC